MPYFALWHLPNAIQDSKRLVHSLISPLTKYFSQKNLSKRLMITIRKIIFKLPLALCTVIAILCCNGNRNPIDTHITEGLTAFDKGFYKDAIFQWKKALERSPSNHNLNFLIARAYQHLTQFDASTRHLKKVIAKQSDAMNAHLMIVQNELFSGNYESAKQMSRNLETLFPDSTKVKTVKGDIAAFIGQYKEAEDLYRQAIAIDSDQSEPFFKLAAILLVQEKTEPADELFRKAVNFNEQSSVQYWLHRAAFHALKGDSKEAEFAMRRALSIRPNSFFLKIKIAKLLLAYKKYDALIQFIEELQADSVGSHKFQKMYVEALLNTNLLEKAESVLRHYELSKDPDWLLLFGKKCLLQGSYSLAIGYFEQALTLNKNDPNATYMLALSYLASDRVNLASQTLIRLLITYPKMVEAELALATIYYKKGEYDLSIDYLNRVISYAPENPRPYIMLGNCMMANSKYDAAKSIFQNALIWDSDSLAARYYLALAQEKVGLTDDAILLLQSIISEAPNKADIGLRLANLLIQENRIDEAVILFKSLASDHPQNGYHKLILGNIYRASHHYDKAAYYYRMAVDVSPKLVEGYKNWAELQPDNNRKITIIKEALKKVPDSIDLLMFLASIYFDENQFESAISVMNEAYLIAPQNSDVANNLSWLYLETDTNLNKAYELTMSAFEKDQDNPSYAHTLGWALHKKGFLRKAEWQFRESLRLINNKQASENKQLKAIISYHLALTLLKIEQKTEAKEKLAFAIETGLPPRYKKHARKILETFPRPGDRDPK